MLRTELHNLVLQTDSYKFTHWKQYPPGTEYVYSFGMGGALLQQLNRDTQKFAFKTSSVTVKGEERDVFKDPVEGHEKLSKRGRLALHLNDGSWATVCVHAGATGRDDRLQTVFRDGEVLLTQTVAEIRERAATQEQVILAT